MNRDILVLREAVTKLTPMLAGMGLKVTQRGTQALVEIDPRTMKPVRVNIPFIPDNADESLILAIQGFIDHEVAHILFTDYTVLRDVAHDATLRDCHNIVEDTFIERAMGKKFPGSVYNVQKLHDYFVEFITKPALAKAAGDQNIEFGILIVPLFRAWAGQPSFIEFMKGYDKHPVLSKFIDAMPKDAIAKIPLITNSREALAIAQIMDDILNPPLKAILDVPLAQLPQNAPVTPFVPVRGINGKKPYRFESTLMPNGLVVDPRTGAVGGFPTTITPPGRVTVTIFDKRGHSASQTFEIEVLPPPPPSPSPSDDKKDDDESKPSDDQDEGEKGEDPSDEKCKSDKGSSDDEHEEDDEAEAGDSDSDEGGEGEDDGEEDAKAKGSAEDADDTEGDKGEKPDDEASGDDGDDAEGDADGDESDDAEDGAGGEDSDDKEDEGDGSDGGEDDDDDASVGDGGDAESGEDQGESDSDDAGSDDDASEAGDDGSSKAEADADETDTGSSAGSDGDKDEDAGKVSEAEEATEGGDATEEDSDFAAMNIKPGSFDDQIAQHISDDAVAVAQDADYLIYTKELDRIEPIAVDEKNFQDNWAIRLDDDTRHMVGKMQKDIERMMAARSQVVRVPGYRSGRLHSSGLHRLMAGDDRVFRRKFENKSKDTAVSLLVDCSGSMGGPKLMTAVASAFALSSTLERVGITHECIGFTTWGHYSREVSQYLADVHAEQIKIGRQFSRIDPIMMPVFKGFDEKLTPQVKRRFAETYNRPSFSLGGNVDGECVETAIVRLLQRREKRKVLLVLSDGKPNASGVHAEQFAKLTTTVKDASKKGVECIGIGIMDDSVKRFYPKFVVLNDINQLPGAVMGELMNILSA